MDPEPYDVLAVELSSFQLHWSHSLAPAGRRPASTSPPTTSTGTARSTSTRPPRAGLRQHRRSPASTTCRTSAPERLVEEAEVQEGCRAVGFTLGRPRALRGRRRRRRARRPGVRRAAAHLGRRARHPRRPARRRAAARHRTWSPTPSRPPPWPARTGCRPAPCGPGCATSCPSRTASPRWRRVDGIRCVDDSKATNPHAARASLAAYEHVVWVAGGLLKGADVDDLVAGAADRLRGVVLIGRDRARPSPRHWPDTRRMSPWSTSTAPTLEPWTWW